MTASKCPELTRRSGRNRRCVMSYHSGPKRLVHYAACRYCGKPNARYKEAAVPAARNKSLEGIRRIRRNAAKLSTDPVVAQAQREDAAKAKRAERDALAARPLVGAEPLVPGPRGHGYVDKAPARKPQRFPRITDKVVEGWPEHERVLWHLCGEHWPEHRRVLDVWEHPTTRHSLADLVDAVEKSSHALKTYAATQQLSFRPKPIPPKLLEINYALTQALIDRARRAHVALQGS